MATYPEAASAVGVRHDMTDKQVRCLESGPQLVKEHLVCLGDCINELALHVPIWRAHVRSHCGGTAE